MAAPRVDLYGIIHKMLRVEFFQTASLIGATNFADPQTRAETAALFGRTKAFLDEHGGHEDDFVEPSVREVNPDLAARLEKDHIGLDAQLESLAELLGQIEETEGEAAVGLGAQLHKGYSDFIGAYLMHMSCEETEVNETLWAHYTDDELAGIRGRLQGSIPPPRFAEWFALMVPAMNLQERIGVLTGMKLNAPPPVFDAMSGVAKEAIGEEAWGQVAGALP